MRSMFTLIVRVCDDEGLQKKLPQFLILSSAIARSSEIDHMRTMLPPNVFLWTRERAWTTTEVMVCVAKTLHACLRDDLEGRQVIFSSDVYRAHIATEVWRAMARLNFFYFLIPAKMTWAMQPCDTHVFALFKRHLAEAAQTVAVSAEDGHVPLTALVKVVCDIIVKVIRGRSWAKAFSDIGLVGHQTAVSQSVLGKLKLAAAPPWAMVYLPWQCYKKSGLQVPLSPPMQFLPPFQNLFDRGALGSSSTCSVYRRQGARQHPAGRLRCLLCHGRWWRGPRAIQFPACERL